MNTTSRDNAPSNADPDILRSDPAHRRKLKWMIAAMIAAALLLWLLGLSAFNGSAHAGDAATMTHRLQAAFCALSALLFATAAYAGWQARRIFRSSQYPPPGSWVLRDTRVLRGAAAHMRGWLALLCAVISLLLAAYAATLPMQLERLLKTRPYQHVLLPPRHAPQQPAPIAPPHGK